VTPKQRVLLRFAVGLVLAIPLVWWNPGGLVPEGLRDNLVAELVGALITVAFVERALDVAERRGARQQQAELRRTAIATLEADLHALWSLMDEPKARDDPVRRAAAASRIERFLRDLERDETWAQAPAAHALAVRGRIRDLGEDADRLLLLAENVEDVAVRARFDALRIACRDLDETWTTTPRGQLASTFRDRIATEVRAIVGGLEKTEA
jgi:hypothetical protein